MVLYVMDTPLRQNLKKTLFGISSLLLFIIVSIADASTAAGSSGMSSSTLSKAAAARQAPTDDSSEEPQSKSGGGMGSMLPMMMMMGGGGGDMSSMLPLMMMGGMGGQSGGKSGGSDPMAMMLPMMMMNQGSGSDKDKTSGSNPMSSMLPLMMMSSMGGKSGGGMESMLPMMMMGGMGGSGGGMESMLPMMMMGGMGGSGSKSGNSMLPTMMLLNTLKGSKHQANAQLEDEGGYLDKTIWHNKFKQMLRAAISIIRKNLMIKMSSLMIVRSNLNDSPKAWISAGQKFSLDGQIKAVQMSMMMLNMSKQRASQKIDSFFKDISDEPAAVCLARQESANIINFMMQEYDSFCSGNFVFNELKGYLTYQHTMAGADARNFMRQGQPVFTPAVKPQPEPKPEPEPKTASAPEPAPVHIGGRSGQVTAAPQDLFADASSARSGDRTDPAIRPRKSRVPSAPTQAQAAQAAGKASGSGLGVFGSGNDPLA